MNEFVITPSFVKVTAALGDAEVGRLFRAMCVYALSGDEPELRGNERVLFPAAKMMIDANRDLDLTDATREKDKERTKEKEKERACDRHTVNYSSDFEEFWKLYPRKIDKQKAYKAWNQIDFRGVTLGTILKSVQAWAACEQWENERFIPHPTVFLNNKRWESDPPRPAPRKKHFALEHDVNEYVSEDQFNAMCIKWEDFDDDNE